MPKVREANGAGTNSASDKQSSRSITHSTEVNGGKKFRHQNYNKNIYIGTKNAEKWELTRARLAFKNDVEFVAYLLKLADGETGNKFPERFVILLFFVLRLR